MMYNGCVSELGGTIVAYDGFEQGQIRDAEYNKKLFDGRDVRQQMSSRCAVGCRSRVVLRQTLQKERIRKSDELRVRWHINIVYIVREPNENTVL
jgi:hypothetical protein